MGKNVKKKRKGETVKENRERKIYMRLKKAHKEVSLITTS